jgi:outer membrane receptor protein involved in Fe transport
MLLKRTFSQLVVATALCVIASTARAAAQVPETQLTIIVTDPSGGRVADAAMIVDRPTEQRAVVTRAEGAVTLEVGGVTQNVLVEAASPSADQIQLEAAATGGTRLAIPVRELPSTLTIITQDLLQERGVGSATEATELSPGITTFVDSGSIPGINARGFSSTSGAVSVTRDGIRQNTVPQAGRPLDTFLLERVEVLKGPASLLAGEGAIGASINYVTKEPKSIRQVDTLLSYGSWDKYRVGFGISMPVTPKLAARIDFSLADGGGYVDRTGHRRLVFPGQARRPAARQSGRIRSGIRRSAPGFCRAQG